MILTAREPAGHLLKPAQRPRVQSTNRCLAFHRLDGAVALQSRQRKSLTAYFPEITAAVLAQVPPGTVLDGELVIYRDGRCDFAALHRRLARPTRPPTTASYVVFDVLAVAGRDLRGPALPQAPQAATTPARRHRAAAGADARHPRPRRRAGVDA